MAIQIDDFDQPLTSNPNGVQRRTPGDFLRDGGDTPWVVDPTGATVKTGPRAGLPKLCKYGRPSSLGKDIENTYNLDRWRERKLIHGIAAGMLTEPTTLVDTLARLGKLEFDDCKSDLDGIVVQAEAWAKANEAAARGTHAHTLTELDDTDRDPIAAMENGEALGIPIEAQKAMLEAWRLLCLQHDLEILATEQTVVHDEWRQAGTLDRIVRLGSDLTFANGVTITAGTVLLCDIKGLALDTKIPTPAGWTTIGEIQPGDQVIGSDGKPCNVLYKSGIRNRPCYLIRFDDGTTVVADDEHRWAVTVGDADCVLTTEELAYHRRMTDPKLRRLAVRNARPIELDDADLPLDPYVFGVWLGDGKHTSGEVTKPADNDMWRQIESRGFELGKAYIDKRTGCCTRTVLGIRGTLAKMGVLADKHIPEAYLRGSVAQRLELLRGLMDSDGTWNRARGRCTFTNTNKQLSLAVYELVVSLGERAHISEVPRSGFGVTVTSYDVEWAPSVHNPFAEAGKASRATVRDSGKNRRRLVVSVDPIPSVPTQCIAVDSPDHTYLCTESMVVTHNTGKLRTSANGATVDYWHSYAVQCCVYRDSRPYRCGVDDGDDERGEWPFVMDLDYAVIAHIPVEEALNGQATARLVLVDIDAARFVIEDVIMRARAWQARKDLFAFTMDPPVVVEVAESKVDRTVRHDFGVVVEAETVTLVRAVEIDEGGEMTDDQHAVVRSKADALPPQAKAVLGALTKEAHAAGYPFSIGAGRTMRRWHIYRALLRLATHFGDDLEADFIRATLAMVLPEAAQPAVELGPAIGSLTLDEAQRFVNAAIAVIAANPTITFDDAGTPMWLGVDHQTA